MQAHRKLKNVCVLCVCVVCVCVCVCCVCVLCVCVCMHACVLCVCACVRVCCACVCVRVCCVCVHVCVCVEKNGGQHDCDSSIQTNTCANVGLINFLCMKHALVDWYYPIK